MKISSKPHLNIPFTKEGYENLKNEYQKILETKAEAIRTLSRARELGDLSENGFYKSSKAKLFSIYSNLRRLDNLIKRAKIQEKPKEGIVGIGSKVKVLEGKSFANFYIVGKFEADPSQKKISNESPIGQKLIGKKEGEIVKVLTPGGEINYKILEIINS